ncbi:TetR/AcrR family transcriptional regulator [Microbacterium sp. SORGH_AS_0888]|uniref:TetR/AcrR family transcriptional regulator n=1 Tax=Microbacterium sp. SORGH_AS_0888 TaxID=3041791 RepID=UPI0027828BBD|nr:TetR/AcrR family transcriptional regulator [Microbacterium sp. SORGH_AS_0888]MDQ1130739.1 AcrR family transcriptional regulator [Microbacterium sp. SORGH_AS_0888]
MPRAGVTAARVVACAADIVDDVGWEGLTLALVADRLGVRVPSLYKHIVSLDALRSDVAVASTSEIAATLRDASVGVAGADALRALANAYRSYAHAHPGRYASLQRADADPASPLHRAADEVVGLFATVLIGYRIDGDDLVDAARAVRSSLHGFVSLEAIGGFGLPRDIDRSFDRLVAGLDAMLRGWDGAAP